VAGPASADTALSCATARRATAAVDTAGRATAAAATLLAEHGLVVDRTVVLRAVASVLLRPEPLPLVVRAAVSGAGDLRPSGLARAAREAAVLRHLTAAGAPSVPASRLLPPGPFVRDAVPLVVMERLAHDPLRRASGEQLGESLRAVHAALGSYAGPLPLLPHLAETQGWLARAAVVRAAPADLRGRMSAILTRAQARVEQGRARAVPVHGDAHSGNALRTPDGPRWIDLEDACLGPVEWDLACLVSTARVFGGDPSMAAGALAAYGEHDPALLAVLVDARAVMVAAWTWLLADADPRRVRVAGRRTAELAGHLAGHLPGHLPGHLA